MGHGPGTFREADVRKAIRAMRAAGESIAAVRFTRDGFVIVLGDPAPAAPGNAWDEVLVDGADKTQTR